MIPVTHPKTKSISPGISTDFTEEPNRHYLCGQSTCITTSRHVAGGLAEQKALRLAIRKRPALCGCLAALGARGPGRRNVRLRVTHAASGIHELEPCGWVYQSIGQCSQGRYRRMSNNYSSLPGTPVLSDPFGLMTPPAEPAIVQVPFLQTPSAASPPAPPDWVHAIPSG